MLETHAAHALLQIFGRDLSLATNARILLLAPGPQAAAFVAGLRGKEGAFSWTLLDSSAQRLKILNQPLMNQAGRVAHFVFAKAERLPFKRHAFDAVLSFESLYSIRPPWTVLAEFHRVLTPAGKLILVEPSRQGFFSAMRDKISGPGKRVFSLDEIKYRLARGDYAIDGVETLRAGNGLVRPAYFIRAAKLENDAEPAPQFLTAKEMIERRKNKTPRGEELP